MRDKDLEKYCEQAVDKGATDAKQIHPSSVVTAAWVRIKCQFGCPRYTHSHLCPPHSPTPKQTREVLDCYSRAILFHRESPATPDWLEDREKYLGMLTALEGEMFKDGYYKAFVFLEGPCLLCKGGSGESAGVPGIPDGCSILKGERCRFGDKARPSMEACGIDVFQTARNNGFSIKTLREQTEPRKQFCLMLVD